MKNLELKIVEPPYYSNWADMFFPKVANKILPYAAKISFLTPNIVTVVSFLLYALASIFLFLNIPYHLILSFILFPISYTLDCLDGQLARYTKRSSNIGDYLDKVLDVLKIYIVTLSLSYAVYSQTGEIFSIILGFTACFFFNFRYYIKLETVLNRVNKEKEYLINSRIERLKLYEEKAASYRDHKKSIIGKAKLFWYWNRTIFFVDEAEFVVFTALGALFNQLGLVLVALAVSQMVIAIFRFFERGSQINSSSKKLYWPMRK